MGIPQKRFLLHWKFQWMITNFFGRNASKIPNKYTARFILTAFLPQRQNATIFPSVMISDLPHSSARTAGDSGVLPPAGQRHEFSGKRESRIESYFGVFLSRFFVLIQSEGPISLTWAQSKDVPRSEIGKIQKRLAGFYHHHHWSSPWRILRGWRNRKTYRWGGKIPPHRYC